MIAIACRNQQEAGQWTRNIRVWLWATILERIRWCREGESNPHRAFAPADFKSAASANFAIPACFRTLPVYGMAAKPPSANGNAQSPCDFNLIPPGNLPYSFNFDDGFEGTGLSSKEFYVMMYYPAQ